MKRAVWNILADTKEAIYIEDLGSWDKYLTITNDAENVIDLLIHNHDLTKGKRVIYKDSEGVYSELLHDGEKFTGFGYIENGFMGERK